MAERGIDLAHTTSMRWAQRYVPEFAKRWQRYAQPVGRSRRIDETYSKIQGTWAYLYRGADTNGQPIDFFFSEQRDMAVAKRFLQQAIEKRDIPLSD
jgi:transposase-like protein